LWPSIIGCEESAHIGLADKLKRENLEVALADREGQVPRGKRLSEQPSYAVRGEGILWLDGINLTMGIEG
jgi:hypothetical protein